MANPRLDWSDALCIEAQSLRDAGFTYRDIAKRIGSTYESVRTMFLRDERLTRHDEAHADPQGNDARYVALCLAQGGFKALHEDRYAKGVCVVRPFYAVAA